MKRNANARVIALTMAPIMAVTWALVISHGLFVGPARAQEALTGCIAQAELESRVSDSHGGLGNLRPVPDDAVPDAAYIYNAIARETTAWDSAYLADDRSGGGVLIVGIHGQMCSVLAMPNTLWPGLVRTLEGEKS